MNRNEKIDGGTLKTTNQFLRCRRITNEVRIYHLAVSLLNEFRKCPTKNIHFDFLNTFFTVLIKKLYWSFRVRFLRFGLFVLV